MSDDEIPVSLQDDPMSPQLRIHRWRNARLIFATVAPFPLTIAGLARMSESPKETLLFLFISSFVFAGYVLASLAAIAFAIEHFILNSIKSVIVVALIGSALVAVVACLIGATFITIPALFAGFFTYIAVAVNYKLSVAGNDLRSHRDENTK